MKKVLVANRGEIAVRVVRACRELGLASVAVYSEPDRLSPHVLAADEAVPIGPAPATESYLDVDALLEAARRTGADAVHPGYGFLAENSRFARRVEEAGLAFVGPPADAIALMGDKTAARTRMMDAGVPVIPGSEDPVESLDDARTAAGAVGFPLMLKAAAGGGGKGMRTVEEPAELEGAFRGAQNESRQAFGDDRIYLERYLRRPRHIEIQVLADSHGRTVHLGERECSIQRRHQKLVEEAPSTVVGDDLRQRMGEVAVAAAEAVGYRGAGTVEYLFQDGDFFFLEMNTRIQVEHPVTEMVTGVDLVKEQLRIAAGHALEWAVDRAWPRGHAMECRISGEDPSRGFLPATGRIRRLHVPTGAGIRWDGGIQEGFEVGLHYDPLLAKLVVHAGDRESAIERMRGALRDLEIVGLSTTQPFHMAVMEEPDFRSGDLSTRYVDEHPELLTADPGPERIRVARVAAALLEEERRQGAGPGQTAHGAGRRKTPGGSRSRADGGGRSAWQRAFDPR